MLHWIDITIIVLYLLLIIVIGIYYASSTKEKSSYFLANKNVEWIVIGTSMFATNISSAHFIGLTSSGYSSGLLIASYDLIGALCCLLLGYFFGPHYLKAGIYTLPEYIGKRFDSTSRLILSIVSIIAYILTKISMILLAGGILLGQITGVDIYTSSLCLILITGLYAVAGGIRSITYTSFIQTIVLIIGAITLTVSGFIEVGGINKLVTRTPPEYWDIIRPFSDDSFPWTGVFFGIPIVATWYHCMDHYMVQKYLIAKDINHATSGSILTAYLKIIPVFFLIIPGMIAFVLYPGISGDQVFTAMILNLLGPGLKGIVIAGFLASITSSLASAFNSCSALFTFDIYQKLFPNANDFVLVNIGRIANMVTIVFAMVWVTFLKDIPGEMYIYLQNVSAYVAPPIASVFILGIVWKGSGSKAATVTLITGFVAGIGKLVLESMARNDFLSSGFLYDFASMGFLHFACLLFVFCVVCMILISIFSGKSSYENKTDFKEVSDESYFRKDVKWARVNLMATFLLLLIILSMFVVFSG